MPMQTRPTLPSALLIALSTILPITAACAGEKNESQPSAPPKDTLFVECTIRVVNQNGAPLKGALVRPSGFRVRQDPRSWYGWVERVHGPRPTQHTEAQGIANFKIPRYVYEELETIKVSWLVDHEEYVAFEGDRPINTEPAVVTLRTGYRIAATARDAETRAPIREHLYAVMCEKPFFRGEWKLADSGILVSRVLDDERTVFRLVHLPPNRPARFSDLVMIQRPEGGDQVFRKNIELVAGVRVEGSIDPAVPRPIKNGHVAAFIATGPGIGTRNRQMVWAWNDKTEIRPDGSFVFESLPRYDAVQMFAVCDGWISSSPTNVEIEKVVPWMQQWFHGEQSSQPQVFLLDDERIQPTLEMERTAVCEVHVLKPDGTPLPNAVVDMWPNSARLAGGSIILGWGFRTADHLRSIRAGGTPVWPDVTFLAKTNEGGIAVIKNVQGKPDVGLAVTHDRFEQPIVPRGTARDTAVWLKPGETTRLTIKMQHKGSKVLGR